MAVSSNLYSFALLVLQIDTLESGTIKSPNIIWVANRDKPLKDFSGFITISKEGNLQVLNRQNEIPWSSNVSNPATNNTNALLLDSGNLVLQDVNSNNNVESDNERIIWGSFDHPCDSFLSKMKIGTLSTGKKQRLISWKSPLDPSIGSFSAGTGSLNVPEIFVWNGSCPYWRSGPWNDQTFLGLPIIYSEYFFHRFDIVHDKEGSIYMTFYGDKSFLTNFVLNSQGTLGKIWVAQETECDVYGKCGAFGSFNLQDSPIFSCLRGFEPKNKEEWNRGNWTSGCVRRTQLQCERVKSGGEEGKQDGFFKLKMIKVPDFVDLSSEVEGEDGCKRKCFKN